MTSKEMKFSVLNWMWLDKRLECFATEYKTMDVFGVSRGCYGTEVEVKVSKNDFESEIKSIKAVLTKNFEGGLNKLTKHSFYLDNLDDRKSKPHYFYFAVPEEMAEYAAGRLEYLDKLSGTTIPYGLLVVTTRLYGVLGHQMERNKVETKRPALKLSVLKFDDFRYFARKASTESLLLWEKVLSSPSSPQKEV